MTRTAPGRGHRAGRRLTGVVATIAALPLVLVAPWPAAAAGGVLVVDRDGAQCGNARFTSIQAAVDAARPGAVIQVCPDLYAEAVVVDKPLRLMGSPEAMERVDCFGAAPGRPDDVDPARHVVVDPPGDGYAVAVSLRAPDVTLAGFVVQGATVGVDAADRFSGYRVRHNLIRLNTLFGVDFGSDGARTSRLDHNCLRENGFGVVSELDDDSLWASPPVADEREPWNQRDLRNARIDHNLTYRNVAGVDLAGPGRHDRLRIDHNVSRAEGTGIIVQNSADSLIAHNDVAGASTASIRIGRGATTLAVASNTVADSRIGIWFDAGGFLDTPAQDTRRVLVIGNIVRGMTFSGINAGPGTAGAPGELHDSTIAHNTGTGNGRDGIVLFAGNSGNTIRDNTTDRNGRYGVYAAGAAGNTFHGNTAFDNVTADARDDARATNTWTANRCRTDTPTGTICGIG